MLKIHYCPFRSILLQSLSLAILVLYESILLRRAVCPIQTIPERQELTIVIVEVQVMHGMTRRTVNNDRLRKILGIIWKYQLYCSNPHNPT